MKGYLPGPATGRVPLGLLALAAAGIDLEEILSELEKRRHPGRGGD